VLHGEGTHPPLDATVCRAQGQRICHRCLPARRLAERVVCPPPKVLGRDTRLGYPGPSGFVRQSRTRETGTLREEVFLREGMLPAHAFSSSSDDEGESFSLRYAPKASSPAWSSAISHASSASRRASRRTRPAPNPMM
jgi:hypothetical protein